MASTDIRNVPATLIDAINGLPDAVFLVMDDGVIIAANTAAGEMFGYSQSQLLGSQVDELIPAGVRAYHQKVRTDAASDRRLRRSVSDRTFDCKRRGGEVFQADVMLSPTRIDGVSMTWAIVRDLDAPNEADASREQELSALDVIGHMAASAFNLHDDFPKVAERLKEVIPHNRIGVALLCEDDPDVVEIAFLSGEDHPIFKEGERTPISSSATGRVVQTRARVSFTKAKTEFAPPAILAGLKQGFNEYCGAPLFDGDSVIGMMMLSTRDARGFSEFQKGLIDRLAKHLSVGIVNERMRGRLRAKTREIESIGEIGKKISSSPDLDAAFSAASVSIRRLVPYDRLSIVSVDLGEGVVTGMFSDGELLPGFDMLTHDLPDETAKSLRKTFDTGRAMLFDQEAIAAVAESQPSFIPYRDAGYRWALVVPLLITQRPVGMMVYGRKDEDGYSEAQIALASRIGEQLAGPIANAFQLTRIEDEARIESILAEIGTLVNTTFDLQEGEHELGPLIRKLVDNNSFTISSVTQDGMHLRWVYQDLSGIDRQADFGVGSVHPLAGTTAERIFQTREPVLVNAKSWADFRKLYPGAVTIQSGQKPKSVIDVPLITNDEIFGFLTLRSVKRNAYTEADVAMSVRIGAQFTGSVALSELRRRDADLASERAVLASIGGLLASAVELSDVWAEFADLLSGLLPIAHVSLTGIDTKSGQATILNDSWTDDGLPFGRKPGEVFPLRGTIAESLAATDQGIIIMLEDPEKLALEFPGTYPSPPPRTLPQSLICVPLAWGSETVAALFIYGLESGIYTPRDLLLAERVAAQIAGSVAGSLLRKRDAALAAERETLARIGSVMGSALDLGDAWTEFTDLLTKMVDFDRVLLISITPETQIATLLCDRSRTGHVRGTPRVGDSYDLKGTIAGHVADTQRTLSFGDENHAKLRKRFPATFEGGISLPWKSNLAVPLIWGGQVVAELGICHYDPGVYDDANQAIVERVAAQIAGPVAGSLLRESELALTVERETLAQIGAVMGSALDLGEAWPEFAELLSGLLPFHHISLVSIDMGSSMVRVEQDWWNSESEVLGRIPGDLFPLSGTIAENLVSTGQGDFFSFENPEQWVRDYPGSQSADVANPMRSALGVPLIWGGHVVAALFIHSFEPEAFTQRELRLAERVAAQIAGPVAGSLLRTREVELVAERETLARIGSVMGSALDLGNAWNEFTDLLAKIVEFDRAQLISIAPETRIATLLYDRSRTGHLPGVRKVGDSYELEGTIIGHVVETQRSLLLDGENSEELHVRFPGGFQHPTKMPWKSNLAVPLIWGGQVVAVLGVRHHDPMKYDDADQARVERVAAQIAGPVAGALLRERDEALVRERVMLTGIGELMGGAPDLGSVFEEFTKQILKLVPFDEMAFLEIDHDRQVVKREHIFQDKRASRSRRLDPSEFSLAGTWVEKVSTSRQGVLRHSGSSEKTDKELPPPCHQRPGQTRSPGQGYWCLSSGVMKLPQHFG